MISPLHPSMATFRAVPIPWFVPALPALLIVPPILLGLALLILDKGPSTGAEGFVRLMPPAAAIGLLAWLFGVWGTHLAMRSLKAFDLRALGGGKPGEIYAGVAYSDGCWSFRNDLAWDRGLLSATPDGLVFRGRASEFALPSHAILGVRLATSQGVSTLGAPRVFIDWVSPDGASSTLSLDAREIKAFQRVKGANIALAERVRTALRAPAEAPISAQWPPAVNPNGFLPMDALRMTTADRFASFLRGVGLSALVIVIAVPVMMGFGFTSAAIGPAMSVLSTLAFLIGFGLTLGRRVGRRVEEASRAAADPQPLPDPSRPSQREPSI